MSLVKVVNKSYEVSMIILMTSTLLTIMRSFNQIDQDIKQDTIQKLKLQISTAVTFIASCHYYLMISSPEKVVVYRYLDWFFTTPLLLLDLCLTYNIFNKSLIAKVIFYDIIMLVLGFLGELNIINKYIAWIAGFAPMIYLFNILYQEMEKTDENIKLYYFFLIVWSFYGIIYPIKNENIRNLTYNILDIIAKGGFAGFIYYRSL